LREKGFTFFKPITFSHERAAHEAEEQGRNDTRGLCWGFVPKPLRFWLWTFQIKVNKV
jgi:hypothetical protein